MTKLKIEIESGCNIFEYILKYIASLNYVNNIKADHIKKSGDDKCNVQYKMSWGIQTINFKEKKITINYEKIGVPQGTSYNVTHYELITLIIKDDKLNNEELKDIITEFISISKKYCSSNDEKYVSTKILKKGSWALLSKLPIRDISTIYLDFKDNIVDDVQKFLKNEEIYNFYGIPYKRNYLFEGPPGTGKTSLIFAIASLLSKDIYLISFDYDTKDNDLMSAISNIPNNAVLVIEDIDSLYVGRTKEVNTVTNVSFSCLLNFLDGIGRKHGLITFITTNYKEKLDPALIRPGRIDKEYKFLFPNECQIKNMFIKYFPKQIDDFENIYLKLENKKICISKLQEFFFQNRENNILDNIDEFIKELNNYNYIPENVKHLYS